MQCLPSRVLCPVCLQQTLLRRKSTPMPHIHRGAHRWGHHLFEPFGACSTELSQRFGTLIQVVRRLYGCTGTILYRFWGQTPPTRVPCVEISTKWIWNESRANTTRHVFHRPRGSSFEATSHGLRTETVLGILGSERMWSQYVAMTKWHLVTIYESNESYESRTWWLVGGWSTRKKWTVPSGSFPINDRIAETCGNYWSMSSDVIWCQWYHDEDFIRMIRFQSLMQGRLSVTASKVNVCPVLEEDAPWRNMPYRHHRTTVSTQCQIFMLEAFSHYCDIRRYKWKTKNCRIFVVQPVQHLLQLFLFLILDYSCNFKSRHTRSALPVFAAWPSCDHIFKPFQVTDKVLRHLDLRWSNDI